jgi:hypothetical protein
MGKREEENSEKRERGRLRSSRSWAHHMPAMVAPPCFFFFLAGRTQDSPACGCCCTVVCGLPAFGCGWMRASRRVRRNARLEA